MSKIIILGAGMVGGAMAIDLSANHTVTVTDLNIQRLNHLKEKCKVLNIISLDVHDVKKLRLIIREYDLVICAVPGSLGFETLKQVIEAGKNVVDISFFPENSLVLDDFAKEKEVTAFIDCGVAPGMDNIILGHYNEELQLTDFECLVGGLPKNKKWPFYYKAPFSPADVIEEYTRPARYVEGGKLKIIEPLTDCQNVNFDRAGTLESFTTDGLRSLLLTMPHIMNMKEKTLRYPGHVEYVRVLKECGFFSKKKIEVNGIVITPFDVTSRILFDEWKLDENEEEITVMRITIKGNNNRGKVEEVIYSLYDEYCNKTQISSMARTTGYTATAVANMFLEGLFPEKGIIPPEFIGKDRTCYKYILNYLEERDIHYNVALK